MLHLCIGGRDRHAAKRKLTQQRRRHNEIEVELAQYAAEEQKNIKLLLLGSGDGGKSTILKQMKLMHNQITPIDYANVKWTIYANVIDSMSIILKNMKKLGIPFKDAEREVDRKAVYDVINCGEQGCRFTPELYAGLVLLWNDSGVEQCYEQRNNYNLMDCAKYFLDSLARIYALEYIPTTQDLLYARHRTTGIVRIELPVVVCNSNAILRVIDVGGQRSERRKWLHCFDDVNCVIFITAISEFDRMMEEDDNQNRMLDSLSLFKAVTSMVFFRQAYIILFLNKIDLFREKIKSNVSLKRLFPNYRGGKNYDLAINYIAERFKEDNPEKTIYTHPTCAVDCGQVQKVITSCTDMIFSNTLNETALY